MCVDSCLFVCFVFYHTFLLVQLADTCCLHDDCKISQLSLSEKNLTKKGRRRRRNGNLFVGIGG